MGVLKIKLEGQRVKYETAKVTFAERDILKARSWKWDDKKNSFSSNDNKLDIIRDHKDFDYANAGVVIRPSSSVIHYEMGSTKGRIPMDNLLTSINHPILVAIRDANDGEGLTQTSANVYDSKNTIYLYSVEVRGSEAFDPSLLEIICIKCPITDQEHIVELRYDGKKMDGGAEGLSFRGEPVSKTQLLSMTKHYKTLPKKYVKASRGALLPPMSVVNRIRTGRWMDIPNVYDDYKGASFFERIAGAEFIPKELKII